MCSLLLETNRILLKLFKNRKILPSFNGWVIPPPLQINYNQVFKLGLATRIYCGSDKTYIV